MQAANRLQKALKGNKTALGAWQMFPGTNLSRTIARSSPDIDWICVDTEHGNLDDHSMHESVAAIAACGVSPVVRVPDAQHWMIKRALDAGAHGIMVPLITSVDDARNVAKWSKFPPKGNRGLGSPFSMEKFDHKVGQMQYFQEANDATLVIVQIETAQALGSVEEIAKVEGIDMLLVGPFDLGNSIGHPVLKGDYDPELKEAITKILKAAHAAGKKAAIYCGSGEQARTYADQGFDMVSISNDVVAIGKSFGQAAQAARGSVLHQGVQGIRAGVEKLSGY